MYALKRIFAYAIDLMLVVTPITTGLALVAPYLYDRLPDHAHMFAGIGTWGISMGVPVLLIGICTGLTGRSPGKLIVFLKVKDNSDCPPGVAHGILREIVKAVSFSFFFGVIYALYGLITCGQTFYDQWMGLEVEDLRPAGLTPTQKKFRAYMRKQGRQ